MSEIARDFLSKTRESANTVIGSILGAYLGFALVDSGLSGGSYFDLFFLLFFLAAFSGFITSISEELLEDVSILRALGLFAFLGFNALAASIYAERLKLDVAILCTILAAWFAIVALDTFLMLFGIKGYLKWLRKAK